MSAAAGQADSCTRPLRRRAAKIARPARVDMRCRKPCLRDRRRLLGWKVRLLTMLSVVHGRSARSGPDPSSRCALRTGLLHRAAEPPPPAARGRRRRGRHEIRGSTLREQWGAGQTSTVVAATSSSQVRQPFSATGENSPGTYDESPLGCHDVQLSAPTIPASGPRDVHVCPAHSLLVSVQPHQGASGVPSYAHSSCRAVGGRTLDLHRCGYSCG